MANFADSLRYARLWLRRQCTVETDGVRALSLARITAMADQAAAQAQEEVLIISNTFEGGGGQGQAKFDKLAFATACEELILEADTAAPREVTQTQATFRAEPATTS